MLRRPLPNDTPLTDPNVTARKIVEIANDIELVQNGRIHIPRVKATFLAARGSGTHAKLTARFPSVSNMQRTVLFRSRSTSLDSAASEERT